MIDVGTRKQLFIDDYVIGRLENVWQVLNPAQKHPANPLVRGDRPWESSVVYMYGSVLYDEAEKRFRMWYHQTIEGGYGDNYHAGLLYATSEDGIRWEKPELGIVELDGSTSNNAIQRDHCTDWQFVQNIVYAPDEPDPQRRYKALAFLGADKPKTVRPGYGALFSPDGIHWTSYEQNPVFKYDHVSVCEVCTTLYDERHQQYVAFVKYSYWGCAPRWDRSFGLMRRCQGIMTSPDFIHWSPNQLVLIPDELDDQLADMRIMAAQPVLDFNNPSAHRAEFYGLGGLPYGDLFIGLLWVYDASGSPLPENEGNPPKNGGSQDGPIHVQLVASRDMRDWMRIGKRMPVLPLGEPGAWDGGMILTAARPVIVGDEIRIYYSGYDRGHGLLPPAVNGAIGLATLRLDGFVSINANAGGGTLTTRLLSFAGRRLVVNAETMGGRVAVELSDESGRPLPGFGASDCDGIDGDAVRHVVTWKGKSDVAAYAGTPIQVRFHLERAKLYAFTFEE